MVERNRDNRKSGSAPGIQLIENKAALLDALPECVFLVSRDHIILTVNTAVETVLGQDTSSVTGAPLREVMSSFQDGDGNRFDINGAVDRVLASEEAELFEAWCKHDSGNSTGESTEIQKVSVSVLPVNTRSRGEAVAIVINGDNTRQPYALRDAVLSMVSHELRTPLLHIKGFVSSLLESDIQWDEETRLDFLHTIDREADRLTSMVSDLMEITRMGSADLPLHLEKADPYLLAYSALDSASPFIRKHRVLVEVPEDLPGINIDVLRVMGVLVNLLQNASKYSEERSKIVVGAEVTDSGVIFRVTDEGVGIPPDTHGKIFSMFFRGETIGKKSSGSGLGLAVCKSVVEAHGGEIWVESKVGAGSTFKFTVPFEPVRRRETEPSSNKKKNAGNTAKVRKTGTAKTDRQSGPASRLGQKSRVALIR